MGFDVTVKEAPDLILRQTVARGLDRFEDMVGFYMLRKKSESHHKRLFPGPSRE